MKTNIPLLISPPYPLLNRIWNPLKNCHVPVLICIVLDIFPSTMLSLLATTYISYCVFGARPVNVALFVVEPFTCNCKINLKKNQFMNVHTIFILYVFVCTIVGKMVLQIFLLGQADMAVFNQIMLYKRFSKLVYNM